MHAPTEPGRRGEATSGTAPDLYINGDCKPCILTSLLGSLLLVFFKHHPLPQHPGQQCGRSEQLTEREPHGAGSVPARSGAEHHVLPAPALAGLQIGNLFMLQTASVCWERERKGVDIPGENSAFSLRGSDGPGPSV